MKPQTLMGLVVALSQTQHAAPYKGLAIAQSKVMSRPNQGFKKNLRASKKGSK